LVLRWHHDQKTPGLTEASYNSLIEWALDIGAKDMTDPPAIVPPAQVVPPAPQQVPPPSPPVTPSGGASDA